MSFKLFLFFRKSTFDRLFAYNTGVEMNNCNIGLNSWNVSHNRAVVLILHENNPTRKLERAWNEVLLRFLTRMNRETQPRWGAISVL